MGARRCKRARGEHVVRCSSKHEHTLATISHFGLSPCYTNAPPKNTLEVLFNYSCEEVVGKSTVRTCGRGLALWTPEIGVEGSWPRRVRRSGGVALACPSGHPPTPALGSEAKTRGGSLGGLGGPGEVPGCSRKNPRQAPGGPEASRRVPGAGGTILKTHILMLPRRDVL